MPTGFENDSHHMLTLIWYDVPAPVADVTHDSLLHIYLRFQLLKLGALVVLIPPVLSIPTYRSYVITRALKSSMYSKDLR